ncbi:MAG: hypothetical protein HY787_20070 [Deltaproteobacteria bacterium]|nr:hypothetical protein [Deltaproteobacteria bacterium]
MCDTVVATAEVTADGVTVFGKNSDREPNEAHHLLRVPASDHPAEAWVLETAGRHWAAKRIKGVYAISNGLTIKKEWDLASPDLVNHALRKGWCKGPDDFDFAQCYSDFLYTRFSDCRRRRQRTTELLSSQPGKITAGTMMAALRDHRGAGDGSWRPDQGLTGATVCMHAGFGPIRRSQTTGSMVSHLQPDCPTHFFTGTAAPCTGIFKPVWLDNELPDLGPVPRSTYDPAALYWRHETLHRTTLRNFSTFIKLYQPERETLEHEFYTKAIEFARHRAPERLAFNRRCFAEAEAAEIRWLERLANKKIQKHPNGLYSLTWKKFNRQAQMPLV